MKTLIPYSHCTIIKPYPDDLSKQFYQQYGGELDFSKKTASPILGSLNSGLQIYRVLKEKPDVFSKVKYALHLPQYLSSILSKRAYTEITSLGCHTGLWDFDANKYHEWVFAEGIKQKFPPILRSDMGLVVERVGEYYWVGVGLHDSSAALIPYLASFQEPFILLSTGTWCISLNPFNNTALSEQELTRDCLCYLTHDGKTVKASRLFAGHEHEIQARRIADYYNLSFEELTGVRFNLSRTFNAVGHDATQGRIEGTSIDFGSLNFAQFEGGEEAYHELMIEIVTRQLIATNLVRRGCDIKKIFIDGGFSKNSIYMNLMAAVFPDVEIFASSVPQASALGAALVIHKHWNKKPVPQNLVNLKHFADATR